METCEHNGAIVVYDSRRCPYCELEKEKVELEGRVENRDETIDALRDEISTLEDKIAELES